MTTSQRSILWLVLLSLVTLLVISGLSYHAESPEVAQMCALTDQDHHQSHDDPCGQGFCHLGHCAILSLAQNLELSLWLDLPVQYGRFYMPAVERFLEGPFWPPRLGTLS